MILNSWKYAKSQGCRYWHEPFVDILSMTFLSSYTCKASMHDVAQVIVPPPTKEKHYRRYLHCLQNDITIMLLFLMFWFSWSHAIILNKNLWILRYWIFSTGFFLILICFYSEHLVTFWRYWLILQFDGCQGISLFGICEFFMEEYIQIYEHTIAQYNNVTLWIWNPVH